jgi:hypothetical protein
MWRVGDQHDRPGRHGSERRDVQQLVWCTAASFVQSQSNGLDAVVFLVQALRVAAGATLRVLGNRPAIFVVAGSANIDGVITVSPDIVGDRRH